MYYHYNIHSLVVPEADDCLILLKSGVTGSGTWNSFDCSNFVSVQQTTTFDMVNSSNEKEDKI